ncbi:MAG: ABC transporter ATP-binding protein [Spirochaetaceae bacterium]|jgi:iron(III) transport system ATP-binding protein|nr:ABC transporter ATP-binding protein [Spirochaetaceae bacterium]
MNKKNSVSVTLEGVTKIFKNTKGRADVIAVHESNFTVNPGDLVTLLGPSGCGKTTTLRMIAGFELPSSGKIRIGSEDVTMLPPNLRDTATVFQSYGLFPHMTVGENVAYGLKLRKLTKTEIETKVRETLALVGLEELWDRPPGQLSGGQQQRVALARSLIVEPSVLLLDEPLSNLDALLREQMRVEIRRIQKSLGITAVYVTHDRVEAMSLSDQVIVMRDGEIKQIGSPQEIYEDPVSKFVAGFVGKAAFFPVELLEKDPYLGPEHSMNAPSSSGVWRCRLENKTLDVHRFAPDVEPGKEAVLMARPESLRLAERGKGFVDGTVRMNVYLGHSIECFVETPHGEVLIQIDDPASKTIFPEGSAVSIDFVPERVRILRG